MMVGVIESYLGCNWVVKYTLNLKVDGKLKFGLSKLQMQGLMWNDYVSESSVDVTTDSRLRDPVFIERFGILFFDK